MNTALLVDSDDSHISEIKANASKLNLHVASCKTADEADAALSEWTFSIAIVSADLPGHADLIRSIRAKSPDTRICLISECPAAPDRHTQRIALKALSEQKLREILAR